MRTLVSAVALSFITLPSHADTITVCADGCDYTSIQAAIDAASNGDVINLTDKIYEEGAEIDMRGKAITLQGSDFYNPYIYYTKIKGDHSHRLIACRSGETSNTILQDITFTGGGCHIGDGNGGGGLLIQGSSPTIHNCEFKSNKIDALMHGGGVLVDGGSPHFIKTTFESNGPLVGGGTLLIWGGGMAILNGNVTMEGPEFTKNYAHIGGGLWVNSGASAHLQAYNPTDGIDRSGIYFRENTAFGMNTKTYSGQGAGGAIFNWGNLTIDAETDGTMDGQILYNIAIASNEVGGQGGGIYHTGTSLIVKNTDIEGNSATLTPYNVSGRGGGIYAVTSITNVVNTQIIMNYPDGIGSPQGHATGLQGEPPVVALESCTIHGNGDDETAQQIDGLLVLHLGDNHISRHAPPSGCLSDLNDDGTVNGADLAQLLGAWGVCP